jgi:hypothetical protein
MRGIEARGPQSRRWGGGTVASWKPRALVFDFRGRRATPVFYLGASGSARQRFRSVAALPHICAARGYGNLALSGMRRPGAVAGHRTLSKLDAIFRHGAQQSIVPMRYRSCSRVLPKPARARRPEPLESLDTRGAGRYQARQHEESQSAQRRARSDRRDSGRGFPRTDRVEIPEIRSNCQVSEGCGKSCESRALHQGSRRTGELPRTERIRSRLPGTARRESTRIAPAAFSASGHVQ